ncbi:MAG TPA: uracil-DNA glycosylase family protein [Acidimicrobiales bacterium]
MPGPLEVVAAEAAVCTKCRLAAGRKTVVFGMGDPTSKLMFIGEGPGAEEDRQGLPFVGRSGQLLDRLIAEELGTTRAHCYVCNTVKCLRYTARVQLGDGSWERIGRLVRSRYDGLVRSVDEGDRIVNRRVVGWHASPLAGRRVYRMTYDSAKRAGAGQVSVELTGDHPVLTEQGWIPVQDLHNGALVATGQGLSDVAFDVVCGTVLGDGHLYGKSAHLSFSHSAEQEQYARFKAELLTELAPAVKPGVLVSAVGGGPQYETIAVRTLAHRALGVLRREFYAPRKVVPWWLPDRLNPRMLAVWFLDDGYLRLRPNRRPSAEAATCGFHEDDVARLGEGLTRLGLAPSVRRGRLFFGAADTERLSELIAPYTPPSMRYKLHPQVAAARPFDPSLLQPGPPTVLYDTVHVQDITDRPRTDTTFFCIDVEDTHNFVTTGGVVHNCRPPENRDPKPDELDACRPYLQAQLDIIRPAVVITLGRFAAQWLLETNTGITKLRGRSYPFAHGVLIPTLHPAAALRGGAQPLAEMRADFVRAKLALADAGVTLS